MINSSPINTIPFGSIGLWGRPSAVVVTHPDILAAFLHACSDGHLATEFGETDPTWHPKFIRDEDELSDWIDPPYLVAAIDLLGEIDPPTYDGDTAQRVTIRAEIFATTKAESIRLAREVLLYFRDDPDGILPHPMAPGLEWEDGIELFREVRRSDPEPIGAQHGSGGMIVSGSRVRIEFMTQFNIYGVRSDG